MMCYFNTTQTHSFYTDTSQESSLNDGFPFFTSEIPEKFTIRFLETVIERRSVDIRTSLHITVWTFLKSFFLN